MMNLDPSVITIAGLFGECVRRHPNQTAAVCGSVSVTYAELDARATALAQELCAKGIRESEPVALIVDPSIEMLVAMLATSKAGCAYLPIDPGLPAARITSILADSRARFLLRASSSHAGLQFAGETLELRGRALVPTSAPLPEVFADLAYIIYTSGTTGSPKGVMVRQRSLVNYVTWFRATYRIDRHTVAPLLTSYAFDLGYTTLWTTILSGGVVHLLSEIAVTDVPALLRYFREHAVTFIKLTPSLLHAIVHSPEFAASDACATIRLIVSGGESIRCDDLRRYYAAYPDVLFVNHYGPTETTIGVSTIPIRASELDRFAERPTIGRPIANVTAHIVNEDMQPLGPGEAGELLIGGISVARGYLHKAELTAQKFIEYPLAPGHRAYRTGDLARWTPEGTIEFLGRIDRQVKVNGYRIELPEIEGALHQLEGVKTAVVVPIRSARQTLQLCAYLVGSTELDLTSVRDGLATTLPHYMVPPLMVQVDALPMTANGKLDVDALPAPVRPPVADAGVAAALQDIQRELAHAWELAGLSPDGPDSNFFMLGGDSIGAAVVASVVRTKFDLSLSAKEIYESPTLLDLAVVVQKALASRRAADRCAVAPFTASREAIATYPPSHEQQMFLHHFELNPVAHCGNLNLRFQGELDVELLRHAVETIHHRHEPLRTIFPRRDGTRIAQVTPPTRVDLLARDIRHLPSDEQDAAVFRIVRELLVTPFDLERGPMLRPVLVRRGARDHHLILSYCHVNIDRWSIVILLHEVIDLYCALRTKTPSRLPELQAHYSSYARWLAHRASNAATEASLARWRELFRPVRAQRSLATGPRAVSSRLGECSPHVHAISPERIRRLEAVCKVANCSVATALLIAYGIALERYIGPNVVIDTFMTSAIRGQPEMAPVIGPLADIRPLVFATSGLDFFALAKHITRQQVATSESLTPGIALRTCSELERARYGFNYRVNVPSRAVHRLPGVATSFHYGPSSLFTRIELPELGLVVDPITYPAATRRFTGDQDVFLGINEIDGQLSCVFWCLLSKQFDAPTQDELVATFVANVDAILERPHTPCDTWSRA